MEGIVETSSPLRPPNRKPHGRHFYFTPPEFCFVKYPWHLDELASTLRRPTGRNTVVKTRNIIILWPTCTYLTIIFRQSNVPDFRIIIRKHHIAFPSCFRRVKYCDRHHSSAIDLCTFYIIWVSNSRPVMVFSPTFDVYEQ